MPESPSPPQAIMGFVAARQLVSSCTNVIEGLGHIQNELRTCRKIVLAIEDINSNLPEHSSRCDVVADAAKLKEALGYSFDALGAVLAALEPDEETMEEFLDDDERQTMMNHILEARNTIAERRRQAMEE